MTEITSLEDIQQLQQQQLKWIEYVTQTENTDITKRLIFYFKQKTRKETPISTGKEGNSYWT